MSSAAADLARRLARDAEAVCRRYLSNGRRQGQYWIVGDVHNAMGRSLYVRLRGPEAGPGAAGKWADAATGEHGDLLDLIRLQQGRGDLRGAMGEARGFLALPHPVIAHSSALLRTNGRSSCDAARRLFAMGQALGGTPALAYLRTRGITASLDGLPLRYHPACFYREREAMPFERRPALLAAVTDLDGTITGVQRTWIDPAALAKAALPAPRKALGCLLGNGVRFGQAADVLTVGEGIETMLSLRSVMPAMPMIAALSAGHLAALVLPPGLQRLYIARDNDRAGERAARRLHERADLGGLAIRDLVPEYGDFNDDLRLLGAQALSERLRRQLTPEDAARFCVGRFCDGQ